MNLIEEDVSVRDYECTISFKPSKGRCCTNQEAPTMSKIVHGVRSTLKIPCQSIGIFSTYQSVRGLMFVANNLLAMASNLIAMAGIVWLFSSCTSAISSILAAAESHCDSLALERRSILQRQKRLRGLTEAHRAVMLYNIYIYIYYIYIDVQNSNSKL